MVKIPGLLGQFHTGLVPLILGLSAHAKYLSGDVVPQPGTIDRNPQFVGIRFCTSIGIAFGFNTLVAALIVELEGMYICLKPKAYLYPMHPGQVVESIGIGLFTVKLINDRIEPLIGHQSNTITSLEVDLGKDRLDARPNTCCQAQDIRDDSVHSECYRAAR